MVESEKDLAPYAMKSSMTKGRQYKEPEKEDNRLCFERDIHRIRFSDAFRRLEGKAQVFMADKGDNFRKRLTHSLDVASIARSSAKELKLNQDLAEAIALAHDLGHTPFGHIGEGELDAKMQKFGKHFEHNEQSLRVVEKLENAYPGFDGLNLTSETREGMMKHKTSWDNRDIQFEHIPHLEAGIVNLADEIAYTAHDIYDGFNAGLIDVDSLKNQKLWQHAEKKVLKTYGQITDIKIHIKRCVSALIGYLINDMKEETEKSLQENNIQSVDDVRKHKGALVHFKQQTIEELKEMKTFLWDKFYSTGAVQDELEHGKEVIRDLFDAYYDNPMLMPAQYQKEIEKGEAKEDIVKDYIAGMTDRYAKQKWEELKTA
ncbi:deoxyguanosinetriphosphate triphosphohydrolase [Candidatus Peregrinibacteria bacterium]|nr:deoxyguanosinetriphosphate triphosphohydrolase [Candidatus Peregrinibacteria bacterium]